MRRILVSAFVVMLGACTTTQDAQNSLNKWVGRKADDFVSTYGMPSGQYHMQNGDTLLGWGEMGSVEMPTQSTTTGYVNPNTGFYTAQTTTSSSSIPFGCTVQLTVSKAGIIKAFQITRDSLGMWQLSRCSEIFK